MSLLNIIALIIEGFILFAFIFEKILSEEIILFHWVSILWSVLYYVSPTLWKSFIYRFFANIFSAIFIMFGIFNAFMYLSAQNYEERITWMILLITLTGPSALTSFTLLLLLTYSSNKCSEAQSPQIVYIPQITSDEVQWSLKTPNKMMV